MATKHSIFVRETDLVVPTDLPDRTFVHDLRADLQRYLIFQTPQRAGAVLVAEQLRFESSFIDLYSLSRQDTPGSTLGYCIDIKRGNVMNLGVSIIVRKTRLETESKGVVNISTTQSLKLGELLRIFKLGDSALFIGAANDHPPLFY